MPDQRYDASRQTIGTLLSTTSPRIEVPPWQRSYSWGSDEIESFWQDMIQFERQYPDDNVVGEEYFLGSAVLVTGGITNLLLDGQQRLATATILLAVLRDERRPYKADAATRLQNKYIADFDDAGNVTTPVLTLNVYDRDYFRREVQDEPIGDWARPTPTLKAHGLIRKAHEYFTERVRDEMNAAGQGELGFNKNLRLSKILCDHMSVVVVSSTDEDNAAAVFETLNDRGLGLSTPDLLRNLLMRRASSDDVRERVVAAWQTILGVADDASVDDFLRHYWVSRRGDVKSRKLYRELKSSIETENINSLDFSLDLADAVPLYRDIVRAQDSDVEVQRQLQGMRALGAKVLYPAMLSAIQVRDGQAEGLREFAAALVTTYVRYIVIGGRESTTLETTVFAAAAELRQNNNFVEAVRKLRAIAPSAEDFVSRFRRASVSRIATARYLLREIEHAKRSTEEVEVQAPDRVHVEHIYPQTPAADARWANHAQEVNRLGNLTLLGRRLNTSIKNGAFEVKKATGYVDSDILMTQELLAYPDWNGETIDARQDELSRWAFEIWHFTGETLEADEELPPEGLPADDPQVLDELPDVPSASLTPTDS